MNEERNNDIRKFSFSNESDKAVHILEGLLKGIQADKKIVSEEVDELKNWCKKYNNFIDVPFINELIVSISAIVQDNIVTGEEYDDLIWLCGNINTKNKYFNTITSDLQRLHGYFHGILADNKIAYEEIQSLQQWLMENEHLKNYYPYDEICSKVITTINQKKLAEEDEKFFKVFFSDFIDLTNTISINTDEIKFLKNEITLPGICSVDPEIIFHHKLFCFTGNSKRAKRNEIADIIKQKGGAYQDTVILNTDYLIVGAESSPFWVFSCYGRKVEKARDLRINGHKIIIAHEVDFWDALVE